jgi:hypothetical protein
MKPRVAFLFIVELKWRVFFLQFEAFVHPVEVHNTFPILYTVDYCRQWLKAVQLHHLAFLEFVA